MESKEIVVKQGQSIADISIQEYGNYEGVFAIMVDNAGVVSSMSDVLPAGTKISVRVDSPYGIQAMGNKVTNSNPVTALVSGYVKSNYVLPGYIANDLSAIGVNKSGISEIQLELINN